MNIRKTRTIKEMVENSQNLRQSRRLGAVGPSKGLAVCETKH